VGSNLSSDERNLAGFTVLLLVVVAAAVAGTQIERDEQTLDLGTTEAVFQTDDGPTEVTLEIANTPKEREIGLMHRESMNKNRGMVFVFPGSDYRSFWMKNTLIPLDIIFVKQNGEIVNIEHATPEPNASDDELTRYTSDEPVKYVVEMNAGFSEQNSIEAGDNIEFAGLETAEK
jgi:hypothetical protein